MKELLESFLSEILAFRIILEREKVHDQINLSIFRAHNIYYIYKTG